jgi:hypothetical protein
MVHSAPIGIKQGLECTALDDASGFALDRLRTDLTQSRPARLATLLATSYHGGEEGTS